jgi:hypothetical protein
MLNAINGTLRRLLHDRALIDASDVDVSFDVPSEEWVSSLTRPTINLFLFDVNENTERRDNAPQTTVQGNRAERRMPPRRIDLHYMVSVLTADVDDEHELLWRVLATLMKYQQIPAELIAEPLRSISPSLTSRIAERKEGRQMLDVWNALGTEPRPALSYVVTAPLDLAHAFEGPIVLTRTARYRRMGAGTPATRVQIGGTVRGPGGLPLADVTVMPAGSGHGSVTAADGRYVIRGIGEGDVTLRVATRNGEERTVQVHVPGESYDIVLDN